VDIFSSIIFFFWWLGFEFQIMHVLCTLLVLDRSEDQPQINTWPDLY